MRDELVMCGKWNWLLVLLPIGVIILCCCFFWHVFNRTMAQCDKETAVVQFSIVNDCSTNAVFQEASKSHVEKITRNALTDRAEIAEKEHDRFRAELATWLSVFGLLTILVSLIAPVCSLVFQQKEFERLQKLIESQATSIDAIKAQQQEIKKQQEELKEQQEELRKKHEEFTQTAEKVSNDIDSNDANLVEKVGVGLVEDTPSEQQDSLRGFLNYFKDIWGRDKIEEKIAAGIRLFDLCNAKITEAISCEDYDSLKSCLNVMNNANAYLGKSNLTEFRGIFTQRMQMIRPLKHSNEEIVQTLKRGEIDGPIRGFYNSALNLQGGFPG